MQRKSAIRVVIAATCLGLATAACGGGAGGGSDDQQLDGDKFVFVNWGGQATEAATKGWLEPFAEETGASFVTDSPTDNAKIKAMVESGQVTWDVVDNDIGVGMSNCGTLFEELPEDFDMGEIDPQYITDDCSVPIIVQAVGLIYNKDKYGDNPPTETADFLDTENYPGKRVLWNYPTGTVEPLLAADGAGPDEIFPVDWARVEGILNGLGGDLELKETLAQVSDTVESGDFSMCLCYMGRYASAPEEVQEKLGIVWDKTYFAWDGAYVVKGSKNKDAAFDFLQFLATKKGQAGFSKHLAYSPTTKDSLEGGGVDVSEEFERWLPDFNEDKINVRYPYDFTYWSDNMDAMLEEWNRITSG